MKLLAAFLILFLVPAPWSRANDPIIDVDSSDAQMNAAIAKARASVDTFIKLLQAKGADSFCVKDPIKDGSQTEHFWLIDVTYADGLFTGTIDNDPEEVKNVKIGQRVSIKKDDISDWLYMKNGKMYGNYTVRVLLPKMSKEDADHLRSMLAD